MPGTEFLSAAVRRLRKARVPGPGPQPTRPALTC